MKLHDAVALFGRLTCLASTKSHILPLSERNVSIIIIRPGIVRFIIEIDAKQALLYITMI